MILRSAEPRDVPVLLEHHRKQNERDGTSYPMPEIFDENGRLKPTIAMAFVLEDEDGKVQQGIVFELVPEMLIFGGNPKATAHLERQIQGIWYLLQQKGFEVVNCVVPKQVEKPVSKPLRRHQFRSTDDRFAHFLKELKEAD